MGGKDKRKKIDHRTSRSLTIPRHLDKGTGDYATIAYERLLLVDPKGEIDEGKLLEFLEEEIMPSFYKWKKEGKFDG